MLPALLALTMVAAPTLPRPPNVLLIVADDLGYGDLGSYGHPVLKTPALDRLAREGTRLTSYYAPSPLCSPSRASLLTGRIHVRTGIESWIPPDANVQLGPREVTLASLLRRHGYRTAMFGKWHLNGGLDVRRHAQPQDHGFEEWLALHAWAEPHHRNPTNFFRNGRPVGEMKGFPAQIVVDEAVRWLEAGPAGAPFFLYLPLIEPHGTIASPEWFNALYAPYTDRPIDGEDVSHVLRGGEPAPRRPLYWEFADDQGFHFALRHGDSKLIADEPLTRVRMYDLRRDRFEVDDRAARERERVDELLALLRRIRASAEADPLRPPRPPH